MKTLRLMFAGSCLLVLILLALAWPITQRSAAGLRLQTLADAEQLIAGLEQIQTLADTRVADAHRLQTQIEKLRGAVPAPAYDPFSGHATASGDGDGADPDDTTDQDDRNTADNRNEWPELRLTGILSGPHGGAMAVVNGDVYRLRQIVNGLRIIEITPDAVVLLSAEGESRRLELSGWEMQNK